MTDRYHKFAPVLRYLVEEYGMYKRPDGTIGYVGGVEAWANPELWFKTAMEAREFANKHGGKVLKLRIYASREAPRRNNKPNNDDVPLDGGLAFEQGWTDKANPHPAPTVEGLRWISDWWRANADAFQSYISS